MLLLLLTVLSACAPGQPAPRATASHVQLARTDHGWQLLRNGEPYFIKGAGGRQRLEQLRAAGGNSIRTWHTREMGPTLDRAHALGMTVTLGMWLDHERHGFDYADTARVAAQQAKVRQAVMQYKDHPALLMWGIGNEMEGDGKNPLVWKAVNDIARMVKELDAKHPTMTVIASVWPDKIRQLNAHCPDIDIVGINAYGGLVAVPDEARRQGLERPYVVTEFGPTGWLEVGKSTWGMALEPSSTQKSDTYLQGYRQAVSGVPDLCLGCYAFLWGHKQEHTRTWFGLFLPEGERTAAIDVLTREWTGRWPTNRCPAIESIQMRKPGATAHPVREIAADAGSTLEGSVSTSDPDGDALSVRWEIRPESTDKKSGGDPERAPDALPGAIVAAKGMTMTARVPQTAGPYRIFVYVTDGHGNAATANVPLLAR